MKIAIPVWQGRVSPLGMKIAIPLADGRLAMRLRHCDTFALVELDTVQRRSRSAIFVTPPPKQDLFPGWLYDHGVNVVIAGSLGHRSQQRFAENGIRVLLGAPRETPDKLLAAYLDGTLTNQTWRPT